MSDIHEVHERHERSLDVAWKRAVLRWLPNGMTLHDLYVKIGWKHHGYVTAYIRKPDLRIGLIVRMADALGAERRAFAATVIAEMEEIGLLGPQTSAAAPRQSPRVHQRKELVAR